MTWIIDTEDEQFEVTYRLSRKEGKITVIIDNESFDIPAGFMGILASRREMFRIGDEQAVLAVSAFGKPQLIFRGAAVPPISEE